MNFIQLWNNVLQTFVQKNYCKIHIKRFDKKKRLKIYQDGSSEIGCVVRDHRGRFLLACARHIPNPFSVDVLEAMAVELGAITLYRLGCYYVVIEGDVSLVYKS